MTAHSPDMEAMRKAVLGPPADAAGKSETSLWSDAYTSASNQAKTIYNGIVQVADGCGANIEMARLTQQDAAPVMSGRWLAQQAGGLAVSLPLLMLTHKGVSLATERFAAGTAATATSGELARSFSLSPDKLALARLSATGAIFEGAFKPSDEGAIGRMKNFGEGGVSFLAMGLTAQGISRALTTGVTGELPLSSRILNVALPGAGGGAAYGLAHVQSKSILDNFKPAGFGQSIDATASGALLGTALSMTGLLKVENATAGAKPLGKIAEGAPEKVQLARDNAEGGKPAISKVSDDVLTGLKRDTSLSARSKESTLNQADADISAATRFSRNGMHKDAVDLYENAIKAVVKVRGAEHPTVANLLSNMARSDMFLGNFGRSVRSLETALNINKNAFGENSPQLADNYEQLSAVYQRAGNYGQAADSLQNAYTTRRQGVETGAITGPAKGNFESTLRQMLGRVASLYEKSGNSVRANEIRQSIPADAPKDTIVK